MELPPPPPFVSQWHINTQPNWVTIDDFWITRAALAPLPAPPGPAPSGPAPAPNSNTKGWSTGSTVAAAVAGGVIALAGAVALATIVGPSFFGASAAQTTWFGAAYGATDAPGKAPANALRVHYVIAESTGP